MRRSVETSVWFACALCVCVQAGSANARGDDSSGPPGVVTAPPSSPFAPPNLPEAPVAPEPLASALDQERLDVWLEYVAEAERQKRRFSGANQVVASALLMGFGAWGFSLSNPSTELDKGLGLAAVMLSGVSMSMGIAQLAKKSVAETRFARWRAVVGPSMTLREFSRFEGELRAQSEAASRMSRLVRWGNFGFALTGGLVLGLTPVANLSGDGKTLGYIIGGVTFGMGMLGFGMSFAGPGEAGYWSAYQRGQIPRGSSRRWSAAPAVGRNFYGARVVGRF
ncbi:MAG: hypothetical protein WBG86_04485 [Polyangiales bacterium]